MKCFLWIKSLDRTRKFILSRLIVKEFILNYKKKDFQSQIRTLELQIKYKIKFNKVYD